MKTKEDKRKEAAERQKKYDALSLTQKIKLVEKRGGKRELERLLKQQEPVKSK